MRRARSYEKPSRIEHYSRSASFAFGDFGIFGGMGSVSMIINGWAMDVG